MPPPSPPPSAIPQPGGGKALHTEGMDVLLWDPATPEPRLTDIWMMRDPLGWEREQLMGATKPEASWVSVPGSTVSGGGGRRGGV